MMRTPFKLVARAHPSRAWSLAAPILALVILVAFSALVFFILGYDVARAMFFFFVKPLSSFYQLTELLVKATPIIVCALGLSIAFRGNVWNIGAEGQLILGAIAAAAVAIAAEKFEAWPVWPLVLLAGIAGGAAWACIPALLRTRFGSNEMLTSLMLVYVAQLLLVFVVSGPLRDPEGLNFPQSALFPQSAMIPDLLTGYRVTWALAVAGLIAIAFWIFVRWSRLGYEMRVSGVSQPAARFAGFPAERTIWAGLLISGACAGLAGASEVAGPIGQLQTTVSPGYGFAAIIAAFAGRQSLAGIIFASVVISLIYLGGESAQINLSIPSSVASFFQGAMLFFVLGLDLLVRFRVQRRSSMAQIGAFPVGRSALASDKA